MTITEWQDDCAAAWAEFKAALFAEIEPYLLPIVEWLSRRLP